MPIYTKQTSQTFDTWSTLSPNQDRKLLDFEDWLASKVIFVGVDVGTNPICPCDLAG